MRIVYKLATRANDEVDSMMVIRNRDLNGGKPSYNL